MECLLLGVYFLSTMPLCVSCWSHAVFVFWLRTGWLWLRTGNPHLSSSLTAEESDGLLSAPAPPRFQANFWHLWCYGSVRPANNEAKMLLLSEHGRRGGCWPAGLSGFKWYQNKCREFLVAFWEMSSLVLPLWWKKPEGCLLNITWSCEGLPARLHLLFFTVAWFFCAIRLILALTTCSVFNASLSSLQLLFN